MSTGPEKAHVARPPVSTQAQGGTFFRKAGGDSFFGGKEGTGFFSPAVQTKLEVSQPDDPQEKEADAVADNVMRMADPAPAAPEDKKEESVHRSADIHRSPIAGLVSRQAGMGGFAGHLTQEDDGGSGVAVQAKAQGDRVATFIARSARGPPAGSASPNDSGANTAGCEASSCTDAFGNSLASTKGSGSPLPNDTRQSMESRFGADFGGVRVHTGSAAESLSSQISAQAFTHGNDIYFNSGKFNPNSATGGHLLAHELTHTIQQGASRPAAQPKAARAIQRKGVQRSIQRGVEAGSQRTAAVELAKAEVGKVNAAEKGPDGNRTGWERLLEFFKTTFGADKILPEGSAPQEGCVDEGNIKKESQFKGDVMAGDGRTVLHGQMRDGMPSWCGIFAFWALNKGGIPLKKWELGSSFIPPEAAYGPEHVPQAGDIAWRREFSHYALVASSDGANVTTVNGNTAGEDNVGGQIQVKTHPKEHWFSFIDPTMIMEGALRDPNSPDNATAAPAKSLAELRKQLFKVDRKPEAQGEAAQEEKAPEEKPIQAKPEAQRAVAPGSPATSNTLAAPAAPAAAPAEPLVESEQEKEPEATTSPGGFALQRTFDSGKQTAHAAAEAAPAAVDAPVAQGAARQSEDPAPAHPDQVQRQPMNLHNRGPPARAPPASGVQAMVSRRIQRNIFGDAWDAVSDAVSEAASWVKKGLNKAKEWILEKIRDFVVNIKGYKMLCLILGRDPVCGTEYPLTGENLLEAGLDVLPGGSMFKALFIRLGIYGEVAGWLQGRIDDLSALATGIGNAFSEFFDSLSLSDIGDPDGVLRRVERLFEKVIGGIIDFVKKAGIDLLERIKKKMIKEIADFVRTKIPKLYPLLCVALGFDPQTMQDVARNGTNILNALLEFAPEGEEQKKQIRESGTFKKIAAWIDEGIEVFSTAYVKLKAAIAGIWKFVTIENLFSPIQTFQRIYDSFADPIGSVLSYVGRAAVQILLFIKEWAIKKLSAFARKTRGYPLLTVLLGKDPFTGEKVDRNVDNVVKGFMSLMEGGEQQFEQLKQSGAIDKIVDKVEAAVDRLNLTPQAIVALFKKVWDDLSLKDLAHPIDAFMRVVDTLAQPIFRIIRFVIEIVLIAIEAVLILMSFPFDIVQNILNKARQAWNLIKNDPIGFFKNLLACIKQGFIQFFDNIATHLINGVVGWLMSELKDAGVPLLTDFSLQGVISWVLEVLGISMEKIWEKLAAHPRIGPERVAKIRSMINTLEGIWTFIKDVQERGMAAIWDKIQEQLTNLWDKVLEMIKNWIMEKIIGAVVTKLLSMLDPTGIMAVVNSCIAIYKAVQSFIKYVTEMLRIVNSFVEGILAIAEGNIKVGADALEGAMGRAMPIIIGFLANQVGLGGIGAKIAELIGAARELVDKAITWLVNKCVDTAFALLDKLVSMGKSAVAAVKKWLGLESPFTGGDGKPHKVYIGGSESSPVLMVASNPIAYTQFIQSIKTDDPDKDKQQKKIEAKAAAEKIAGDIDGIKSNSKKTEDEKKIEIKPLMDNLAKHTALLFGDVSDAKEPKPEWPKRRGKYGEEMIVTSLHKAQALKGSQPTDEPNAEYAVLNQRRDPGNPAKASFYKKGHLLNDNLGGKGDWQNLIPLSQKGNSNHESMVESVVKAAWTSGAVIKYQVTAQGNWGGNAGSIPKTDPDWAAKTAIIAQEEQVPQSLQCDAWRMEKSGDKWEDKEKIVSKSVPNPVDQSPDSYKLSTSSTIMDYKALAADAKTCLGKVPPETWAVFKGKDRIHIDSVDKLAKEAPADAEALEKQFKDHFRGLDRKHEKALIDGLKAADGVPTWIAFKASRQFYEDTTDGLVALVESEFNARTAELRGELLSAAEGSISSSPAGMLWRAFKAEKKLGFQTVGKPEEDRLAKIQTEFEKHQKSLK